MAGWVHMAAVDEVASELVPPMQSACLSDGHAVSQLAQAPLTGAVHLAGPVSVFRRTTSEFEVVHPYKRAIASIGSASRFILTPGVDVGTNREPNFFRSFAVA